VSEVETTVAPPSITRMVYDVAPGDGVHRYMGDNVVMRPLGLPNTGACGAASATLGVNVLGALNALVPAVLVAATRHVYAVLLASAPTSVKPHAPVFYGHSARVNVSETFVTTAPEAAFATRKL
jgi:hypothetical protein